MSNIISPQQQEYLNQVISEILTKYDLQVDKQSVEDFISLFVEERDTIKDVKTLLGDINRGFTTIDQINEYHQDLINAQSKNKSKASWLKTMIKTTTNIKDVREISKIVQEVQSTLAKSNNQHLASLLEENVSDENVETVEVFTPMSERDFEGINEQAITQDLLGEVQSNSLLIILSTAKTFQSLNDNTDFDSNVSEVAQNCFEGELGNNDELLVKKLATAGVIIVDAEFPIEALDGMKGAEIATIVDMGITIAKVGYKLSQGKMKAMEAVDYIYDRAIADTAVVISTIAKLKIEFVSATIGAAVGTVFGPVGIALGGFVGHGIGKVTGQYIAPKIQQGINKVAKVVKPMVKQVVQKTAEVVKETAKAVWNWLTGN